MKFSHPDNLNEPAINRQRVSRENGSRVAMLFSGQGSQYRQMGRELYERCACFRENIESLDEIFQLELGISALAELYDDHQLKSDRFDKTLLTHPAIFMVQVSTAKSLLHHGLDATSVLGTSLGEYVAAAVAGAVRPIDMMRAVVRSAILIETKCPPGGMLSIFADESLFYEIDDLKKTTSFAGKYMDELFVVSGERDQLKQLQEQLHEMQVSSVLLPVSHAFHSPVLDICESELRKIFSDFTIYPLQMNFYSALVGGQISNLSTEHFLSVGRAPIHCYLALQSLLIDDRYEELVDMSPFGSLAGVIRKISGTSSIKKTRIILSPFIDTFEMSRLAISQLASS